MFPSGTVASTVTSSVSMRREVKASIFNLQGEPMMEEYLLKLDAGHLPQL